MKYALALVLLTLSACTPYVHCWTLPDGTTRCEPGVSIPVVLP